MKCVSGRTEDVFTKKEGDIDVVSQGLVHGMYGWTGEPMGTDFYLPPVAAGRRLTEM